MRTSTGFRTLFGVFAVLLLGACASTYPPANLPYPTSSGTPESGNVYQGYGVVHSIELVQQENTGIAGSGLGIGTVAGAVIGGVLGNQIGGGRGNTVATVAGVAGGAYVGHELESRRQQKTIAHKITVRMNDGSYQTLTQSTDSGFRVGDRVRFENGSLQRY